MAGFTPRYLCRLSWAWPNERAVTASGGLGADHRSDTACSVGLIVRSAPVHNLLPHAHFRHSYTPPYIHPLADFQEFRDRFEKRHLSLFHPASFASFAQIARRLPPSALSSSAASSASSSSLHATWLFFPALPFPFYIQPAHPVGLPRHVLIATARTARVRCRAVRDRV